MLTSLMFCFVMTASISLYKVFFGQLSGTKLFVKNAWLCLICLRGNLLNHCYMGCQNYYIVYVQRRTIFNLNPMASQTMFRLFFHDNIDLWLNNFLLGVKEIISMEVKIFFLSRANLICFLHDKFNQWEKKAGNMTHDLRKTFT